MANTSVEVITLLSSDEESNTKVESAPSAQKNAKPKKVTARKSTHSRMSPIATVIKEEPLAAALKPSPTGEAPKKASDAQAKSSNVTEPNKGSVHQGNVTARKSLKNSNGSSAPKGVSSQCASTGSKKDTAIASKSNILSNAAIVAAAKLPGLTVTPLSNSKDVKGLQKARKTCSSQPLPQGAQNFRKHFQPAATSTPKIHPEMLKNIGQAIFTNAKAFVAKVAEKPNHLKSSVPDATVVSASSTVSSSSDKISLSISTLARILPDVSICPLATTSAAPNLKSPVPTSIITSLGKAGVSVIETTKTAQKEGEIPESSIRTNFKNRKESRTVSLLKTAMTVTKVLSKAAPVNSATEESKTSSEIKRPGKDTHKNSVIDPAVTSKTIPELKTSNNTKNHEIHKHSSNKNTDALIKKKRLDKIVDSLNIVNNSTVINRDSNSTLDCKTQSIFSDPLRTLKSNKSVTLLPVDVNATKSKNNPNNHKTSSKGVSQNSKGNKRLFSNDSYTVNKKTKLETKSQYNGIHANGPTAEENMKRISALKESLKKMSDASPRKFDARHDLLQSSDSQSQRLGNNAKTGSALNVCGQKDNVNKTEKSAHTNLNSPKSVQCERPLKQVTSPKLSLKRRSAVEERPSQRISNQVIALPYVKKDPSKEKAESTEAKATVIPLPYAPLIQSDKKSKLNSTVEDIISSKVENVSSHISPSNTNAPSVPPNKKPKLNSTVEDAKLSKKENVPSAGLSSTNNTSKNVIPWETDDSNVTRFKKLLEFSKSFIRRHAPETTPVELKKMTKVCHKVLDRANSSYVDSVEFGTELEEALRKIETSKDTFAFIENLLITLKAHRKTKSTVTTTEPRRLSNSSEQSEASKLELPPCEAPKEVPAPILGDHLASALHSVTSNLQLSESPRVQDPFPSVPCTSKQADIVENLRLSMPISNGIRSVSDFRTVPSAPRQVEDLEDRLPVPAECDAPIENDVLMADIPAPENPSASAEGESEREDVNAPNYDILIEKQSAHSCVPESVGTGIVNEGPIVNMQPPMPGGVHGDEESNSSESKSKKITSKNEISIEKQSVQSQMRDLFGTGIVTEAPVVNIQPTTPARVHGDDESNSSRSEHKKVEIRVKFLEGYLKKLDKKIKKLQSKELSLDELDDEDSTYLLEDRYKKKFQKTWVALCKIKKRSHLVGRAIDKRFSYQGSRHDAFNRAIEKLINKRKPTEKFPNYSEVHNLLKKVNESASLALDSYEIENAAKEAFSEVGIELKRRRTVDEEQDFGCYLTDDLRLEPDPAEQDEELNKKLSRSVVEGEKKIKEIIDKYASAQREDPADEPIDGSDCEESVADGSAAEEPMDYEDPPDDEGKEELPIGVDAKENSLENTNLPDTDPATPDTDAHEDEPETFPTTSLTNRTAVIDVDSSSNASTEPGSAAESKSACPKFHISSTSRIYIDDMVEIVEDNPTKYDDDSSPDLPPLSELL